MSGIYESDLSVQDKVKQIKGLTKSLISEERKKIIDCLRQNSDKTISKHIEWTCEMDISGSQGRNDMSNYYWINVHCTVKKDDVAVAKENYCINFLQQDFDIMTGNVHLHMDGKIQIWRNLIEHPGCEKNGEIRLGGELVKDIELYNTFNCNIEAKENIYQFYHAPFNAHPVALPKGQRNQKAKDRNEKPWGITLKDIGVEEIPSMDMADDNYNAEVLAEFFIKLIKADIAQKIERYVQDKERVGE